LEEREDAFEGGIIKGIGLREEKSLGVKWRKKHNWESGDIQINSGVVMKSLGGSSAVLEIPSSSDKVVEGDKGKGINKPSGACQGSRTFPSVMGRGELNVCWGKKGLGGVEGKEKKSGPLHP